MTKLYNAPATPTRLKMIDQALRDEIAEKSSYLAAKYPDVFDIDGPVENRHLTALENDALNHSILIECPRKRYTLTANGPKTAIRRKRKQLDAQIKEAWTWGKHDYLKHVQEGTYPLTEDLLLGISQRIEPGHAATYRRADIRVTQSFVVRPSHERVRDHIGQWLDRCKKLPPLEQAIHSHFTLVYIHPFLDGNGRTARMVQNVILRCNHLPPAVIKHGEREFYIDQLERALCAYADRQDRDEKISGAERAFYTYLASKVNIALEDLLENLEKNGSNQ